jgi:predicted Rossmann fold nucleotide-binding protein DprA/Smf involved in DNA uptake
MDRWHIPFEEEGNRGGFVSQVGAGLTLEGFGDRQLFDNKWTAFFCSVRCSGSLILKAYDLAQKWRAENQPVIGGFHSPVEREVLRILLRSTVPVSIVLARCLPKRIPPEFHRPLEEGRLLLLSPFDAKTERATQETAARRNEVVAALAGKIVVAYAASGGKTDGFCRAIVRTGKPCMTFNDPRTANLQAIGFAVLPL